MNKEYFNKWLLFNHERTGILTEKLKKAFSAEFSEKKEISDPLEIPDKMEINYMLSYGMQSRFFRELRDNAKLLATKCQNNSCGKTYFPPRINCSKCYSDTKWIYLSGDGEIISYTVVYFGTSTHIGKLPFVCAYIKLNDIDNAIWHFVDGVDIKDVKIGMKVKAEFKKERFGLITDFVFKPA